MAERGGAALLLLTAFALAALLAPSFSQGQLPAESGFAACAQADVPQDKAAFVEELLQRNSLSRSDFSGYGLEAQVYAVKREACPGGDVVHAYFRQAYNGRPMLNYEGMAHFRDGWITGCQLVSSTDLGKSACDGAKYFDFAAIGLGPLIGLDQARSVAAGAAAEWGGALEGYDSVLGYWYYPEGDSFRLAYIFGRNVSLEFRPRIIDASVVVDAIDGSVLFSDSGIRYGTSVPLPAKPAIESAQDAQAEPALYDTGEIQKSAPQSAVSAGEPQAPAQDLGAIAAIALGIVVALLLGAAAVTVMFRPADLAVHRALSSTVRAELLAELEDTEKILTDLSVKVGRSKATTLEHLEKLAEAGLIERVETPGKKFVFYRITRSGKEALRSRSAA